MTRKHIVTENTFRTKTGYCHILPDKIVLTGSGVIGGAVKAMVGDRIGRILVFYSVFAVFAAYYTWIAVKREEHLGALVFGGVALFLVYNVIRSWNNSATPVLDRSTIQSVVFKPATPGLTRAYFEVHFTDVRRRPKRRLIMLPGSLTGGLEETELALKIMREEGLISG